MVIQLYKPPKTQSTVHWRGWDYMDVNRTSMNQLKVKKAKSDLSGFVVS